MINSNSTPINEQSCGSYAQSFICIQTLVMIVLVLGVVVFVFGTKILIIFARILSPQQRQIYT